MGLRSLFAAIDDWLFVPDDFALESPYSVDEGVQRVEALVKFAEEGKLGSDTRLGGSASADEVIIFHREFLRTGRFEFRGRFVSDIKGCRLMGQFAVARSAKAYAYFAALLMVLVIGTIAWFSPEPIIAILVLGLLFGVPFFFVFAMLGQQNDVDEEEISLALHAVLSADG